MESSSPKHECPEQDDSHQSTEVPEHTIMILNTHTDTAVEMDLDSPGSTLYRSSSRSAGDENSGPFLCLWCDHIFSQSVNRELHMKLCHKDEYLGLKRDKHARHASTDGDSCVLTSQRQVSPSSLDGSVATDPRLPQVVCVAVQDEAAPGALDLTLIEGENSLRSQSPPSLVLDCSKGNQDIPMPSSWPQSQERDNSRVDKNGNGNVHHSFPAERIYKNSNVPMVCETNLVNGEVLQIDLIVKNEFHTEQLNHVGGGPTCTERLSSLEESIAGNAKPPIQSNQVKKKKVSMVHSSKLIGQLKQVGSESVVSSGIHSTQVFYKCGVCDRTFQHAICYQKHIKSHSGQPVFKCEVCLKSFKRKNDLNRHVRCHSVDRPFHCQLCSKTYKHSRDLLRHIKSHSEEKPVKAKVPREKLKQKTSLGVNGTNNLEKKPFVCDLCGKAFNLRPSLITHRRVTHSTERPFKCQLCGKTYKENRDLRRHIETHSAEKSFKCDICGKAFRASRALQEHSRLHLANKPFVCDLCGKSFISKSQFENHMMVHSTERPFQCDLCSKTYKRKVDLDSHRTSHSEEKPYLCEFCGQSFKWIYSLQSHMKHHSASEERPFTCEICSMTFKGQSKLYKHLKSHPAELSAHLLALWQPEERPFKCSICEKAFKTKNHLQNHSALHVPGRPFKCEVCEKTFKQKRNLMEHMQIHLRVKKSQEVDLIITGL